MSSIRHRPPLALTMGEPGGVSAEITLAAWRTLSATGPAFFVIDDPQRLGALGVSVANIESPSEAFAVFPQALPVLSVGAPVRSEFGVARPQTANAVISSIDRAVTLAAAGEAAAVVTNPIQKSALIAAGFGFPGHTEYLEHLTRHTPMPSGRTRGAVMMLVGGTLRTVPITIHHSVREAASLLTEDLIVRKGIIVAEALQREFGVAQPRIAVSGLNPHAGEGGAMGREDQDVIAPAVARLNGAGVASAFGPAPADTLFHPEARARYDAALCMLHDQALIPVKTLHFHDAVNVTLGLPVIRTSPDHGTALDIAGRGVARADSLVAALRLAARLAEQRTAH